MTNKQKVGVVLFCLGSLLAIAMGGVASYFVDAAYHLSSEETKNTIWDSSKPLFMLWAMGVPLGAIIAGIGSLLYRKVQGKVIWLCGLGLFLGSALIVFINGPLRHNAIFFGVSGTLLLLLYLGIIGRMNLNNKGAIFRFIGYTFLIINMWFVCEVTSRPYLNEPGHIGESPINVMIFSVLSLFFLLLGEGCKSREKKIPKIVA